MKKSVLIVLYYYEPYVSGVSVYAKTLAENLVKRGYRITVLTSCYDGSLPREEYINGVRILRSSVLFKLSKGVICPKLWIETIVLAKTHDYVNFHLPLADVGLSSLFIPTDKLITTYQCDINLGSGLLSRIIEKISFSLMNITLKRSKDIVVLSQDYFENSRFSGYKDKSVQVDPPINEAIIKPTNYDGLINKLGLNQADYKIGFVEEKGLEYLLEAIGR